MRKYTFLMMMVLLIVFSAACGKNEEKGTHEGHGTKQEKSHEGHSEMKESHEGHNMSSSEAYAKWSFSDAEAGKISEIKITIQDKSRKPINDYKTQHEKKLHLIVVSKDLSYFHHIHPEFKGDGTFTVSNTFPKGGEYKLIADFVPAGGEEVTLTEWLEVKGDKAENKLIKPDGELVKEADGKQVELTFPDGNPKAGEETKLTFTINENGKPVINLQPYLGAVGHVVILSEDTENYLHVHPLDESAKGPKAEFATTFPKKGVYKIWGQFQQDGELFITDYTIEVN
ncbi:hypothetical protein ACFQPF_14815 [Fictibacillus iocasae]|uniref:YtkA-like domain-containing protein n=1 Tax=Fictibacillus iocasae TaxID=2715437 RepID=A0ABW2NTR2_9BACL